MHAKTFSLPSLLLAAVAYCVHAKAGESSPVVALPPFPNVAEAIAQFDRLDAPGVTTVQRRLILFEGALIVGRLPCNDEVWSDASRGVTIGCLQFGLLGRLQPVLMEMDRAHPDRFAAAFGGNVDAVRAMLKLPTIPAQIARARSITDSQGRFLAPWAEEFATLVAMPEFQSAYLESTSAHYRMAADWARDYGFRSQRGLALMFDLALFRGIPRETEAALAQVMNSPELRGDAEAAELRRLQAFAKVRGDLDSDPLLRFHLTTIAEGLTTYLGYVLNLADFGITLSPMEPSDLP